MYIYIYKKGTVNIYTYISLFVFYFIQPVLRFRLTAHLRKGNGDAGANLRAEAKQLLGLYIKETTFCSPYELPAMIGVTNICIHLLYVSLYIYCIHIETTIYR